MDFTRVRLPSGVLQKSFDQPVGKQLRSYDNESSRGSSLPRCCERELAVVWCSNCRCITEPQAEWASNASRQQLHNPPAIWEDVPYLLRESRSFHPDSILT